MATTNLVAGDKGVYYVTLSASTVDTVTFTYYAPVVEVWSDGADDLYFTVDGSTPTDKGSTTFFLPASQSVRTVHPERQASSTPTVIKLIAGGTPTYSVSVVE